MKLCLYFVCPYFYYVRILHVVVFFSLLVLFDVIAFFSMIVWSYFWCAWYIPHDRVFSMLVPLTWLCFC